MPKAEQIFDFFKKEVNQVAKRYDLDLSLVMHAKFLDRVHKEFYRIFEEKKDVDIKEVITRTFKTVLSKNKTALLEMLYLGKTPTQEQV
jgi:hypothetical protein